MFVTKAAVKKWQEGVDGYNTKDYAKAITAFKSIGENSKMNYNIAICYFTQKKFREAIQELDAATSLDVYLSLGYFTRAFCYYNMQDYTQAVGDYTRSIELFHEHDYIDYHQISLDHTLTRHQVLYHRGLAYAKLRQWDKAMTDVVGASRCSMLKSDEITGHIERLKECITRQSPVDSLPTFPTEELFLPPHIPQVNQPNKAKVAPPIPIKTSIEGIVIPEPKPGAKDGARGGGGGGTAAAAAPPQKQESLSSPKPEPTPARPAPKPTPAVNMSKPAVLTSSNSAQNAMNASTSPISRTPPPPPPSSAPKPVVASKPAPAQKTAPPASGGRLEELTNYLSSLQIQYQQAKQDDDLDQAMMLRGQIKSIEAEIEEEKIALESASSVNEELLQQISELEMDLSALQSQYEEAKANDDLDTAMAIRQAMKACQAQLDSLRGSVSSQPPPPSSKPTVPAARPPPPSSKPAPGSFTAAPPIPDTRPSLGSFSAGSSALGSKPAPGSFTAGPPIPGSKPAPGSFTAGPPIPGSKPTPGSFTAGPPIPGSKPAPGSFTAGPPIPGSKPTPGSFTAGPPIPGSKPAPGSFTSGAPELASKPSAARANPPPPPGSYAKPQYPK